MINLGDKVKDKVTNFTGIAIQRVFYMYGCIRIGIQPPMDKEGKIPEPDWFDEGSIEIIKKQVVKVEEEDLEKYRTGGAIQAVKPIQNPK